MTAFDSLPDFEESSFVAEYEASLAEERDAELIIPSPRLLTRIIHEA